MKDLGLKNKRGSFMKENTLADALRNPFYYGYFLYRGELYKGDYEPIITKKLFDKVQEVMNGKGFKKIRTHYYIFKSLILCPSCNKPLRSVSAKKRYKYYNCRDKQCSFKNIPEPEVEDTFLYELRKLEFNDKEVEVFIKAVKTFKAELRGSQETDIRVIEMEEGKLKQQLDDLTMDYF